MQQGLGAPIVSQTDSLIIWSAGHRLDFDDFQGVPRGDLNGHKDTMAICAYQIEYKLTVEGRLLKIDAYATFSKRSSWMRERKAEVLKHEQGHFDIAAIYAAKFKKDVNHSQAEDPHDFLTLVDAKYQQVLADMNAEQEKYDVWTGNTTGKEYYFTWIKTQLDSLR